MDKIWMWFVFNIWTIIIWLSAVGFIAWIVFIYLDITRWKSKRLKKIKDYLTEATIALVIGGIFIGANQMNSINIENRARFLLDLKQSFYCGNNENRLVIEAIENSTLIITTESIVDKTKRLKNTYTEYELDEYLTNFDYMNIFIKRCMLDANDVYDVFGWYVRKAANNSEVKKYLIRIRNGTKDEKEPDITAYRNFDELTYIITKEYEKRNKK